MEFWAPREGTSGRWVGPVGGDLGEFYTFGIDAGLLDFLKRPNPHQHAPRRPRLSLLGSVAGFKGLRPPAADPQQNEGMMLRGYENHEAIALVTCAS